MKVRSIIKNIASWMLRKGSLVAACSILPLVSGAATPHWDVSGPGQIPNSGNNEILPPMAAKDGALYAINHYFDGSGGSSYQVVRWTKCVGFWVGIGELSGVDSMCISGNYLYVAGNFTTVIPGVGTAVNIAKYNVLTQEWSPVGDNSITDEIWAVTVDSNGRIYIATGLTFDRGGAMHSFLQYWNGTAWTSCGSGMIGSTRERYGRGQVMTLTAKGTDIYAAGTFDGGASGGTTTYSTNIIKWDGTSWHAMGTPAGNGIVLPDQFAADFRKIVASGSDVFVTGNFNNVDPIGNLIPPVGLDQFSTSGSHVHAYGLWNSDGVGFGSSGSDLCAQNGTVYLAGPFSYIDSTSVYAVAQWNGSAWSALGSGVSGGTGAAALAVDVNASDPEDALYVLGDFDHAGGSLIQNGTPVRWVLGPDNACCVPPTLSGEHFVSDSQFQFTINAPAGVDVKVYSADDLPNWTLRSEFVTQSGASTYTDTQVAGINHRLYRVDQGDCCSQAIGFSRTSVAPGAYAMIANQFDAPPNTLNSLLPNVPPGTTLYKWMGGSGSAYTFDDIDLVWYPNDAGATLAPGEGGFIHNTSSGNIPIVFIGAVKQGTLSNPIGASTWLKSSVVPQAGGLTSVLGYQPLPGDEVFLWNGGWTTYIFDDLDLVWTPSEPVLKVGECFRITHSSTVPWTRDFSPCP